MCTYFWGPRKYAFCKYHTYGRSLTNHGSTQSRNCMLLRGILVSYASDHLRVEHAVKQSQRYMSKVSYRLQWFRVSGNKKQQHSLSIVVLLESRTWNVTCQPVRAHITTCLLFLAQKRDMSLFRGELTAGYYSKCFYCFFLFYLNMLLIEGNTEITTINSLPDDEANNIIQLQKNQ